MSDFKTMTQDDFLREIRTRANTLGVLGVDGKAWKGIDRGRDKRNAMQIKSIEQDLAATERAYDKRFPSQVDKSRRIQAATTGKAEGTAVAQNNVDAMRPKIDKARLEALGMRSPANERGEGPSRTEDRTGDRGERRDPRKERWKPGKPANQNRRGPRGQGASLETGEEIVLASADVPLNEAHAAIPAETPNTKPASDREII